MQGSLSEIGQKIKSFIEIHTDLLLIAVIILTGTGAFGLGRLSALEEAQKPITINTNVPSAMVAGTILATEVVSASSAALETVEKLFVASKNGSVYHFPWCSGAQRIKEENKVWFASKEEAEAKGMRPAENCKGL